MRRCSILFLLVMGLSLLSFAGSAQVETLPGLILTDLQLISQESLSHWTPAWTGPIQGATIAAWFAEYGYPALMRDFNGDGIIDELDTIELANDFGLSIMQTETPRGTTDVRLVVGLATYIAGIYPDEFVLKIYDLGFPIEFAAQGYGTFAPDVIPGIILELKTEPSIEAYIHELSTGEGVIVGLEEDDVDRNRYLSGRSFLYEQTSDGYTPLDFAWAKEDNWEPGHQGQVLETVAKMEDHFYLDFLDGWVPVEFMLALSPVEDLAEGHPTEGPPNEGCPDLVIYVLDEGCVYNPREQAYNITVWAEIGNVGNEPVTEPFLVVLNSTTHPGGAIQTIPVPPVFNPGDTLPVTLSFLIPPSPSGEAPCPLTYVIKVDARDAIDECDEENNTAQGEVCCDEGSIGACCLPDGSCVELTAPECEARKGVEFHPGIDCSVVQCPQPDTACPDLTVDIQRFSCDLVASHGGYEITVSAVVQNIGSELVTDPIWLKASSNVGNSSMVIHSDLAPGDSTSVEFTFEVGDYDPCLEVTLNVDYLAFIDECNESNNTASGSKCCESAPDNDDTPDNPAGGNDRK